MMYIVKLTEADRMILAGFLGKKEMLAASRRELEGRWVEHEGVVVRVVLVLRLRSIESSNVVDVTTGNVKCSIVVDALVAAPFVGEVLDVTITAVNDRGFVASAGAFDVAVDNDQWDVSRYMDYDERIGGYNAVTRIPILPGRHARVRILRTHPGHPPRPSEATMIDEFDFLGTFFR